MTCPLHENCKNKNITPKGVSLFKTEECQIYDRKFWRCKTYRRYRKLKLKAEWYEKGCATQK